MTPESRALVKEENKVRESRFDKNGSSGQFTCIPGFVWRLIIPEDLTCVTPERRDAVRAENTMLDSRRVGSFMKSGRTAKCKNGFVWREAFPEDFVCVTPESRAMVKQENAAMFSRIDPVGASGPNSCIAGFVWRETIPTDVVCVTPERRAIVRSENAAAASRRSGE